MTRRALGGIWRLVLVVGVTAVVGRAASAFSEAPILNAEVAAGTLPPVAERLPKPPLVVDLQALGYQPGTFGGSLRQLIGRAQDVRMMVVFGYARLVSFDPHWRLVPDILERVEIDGERVFTFHLRKGHRWSDGHPFTSEDFRYCWDDILTNKDISPAGLENFLLADGKPPVFTVIDETTVRYSWDTPNPYFLRALAGARPEYLFAPAHYLKAFHARYADAADLKKMVSASGQRNWVALHFKNANLYKNENPDLPTLEPWVLSTPPPSNRFVFKRNPYFHRVDPDGRQLPYIDEVVLTVVNAGLIPAKTAAGDADLQARGLSFENVTVLKQGERRHDYSVRLWRSAAGAEVALYPNFNVDDPVWRQTLRNVDVRRALSMAIDRDEINQIIFFGMASPDSNTVTVESPLYRPELAGAWAMFDIAAANRLLDAAGFTKRNARGVRLLADGRPFVVVVETAGESKIETDILQLVRDTWAQIGVKLFVKPEQRELLRNRVFTGSTVMSTWKGIENAVPTADTPPTELVPSSQQQLEWPKWGQYIETRGQAGEPVDMPEALELLRLDERWRATDNEQERARIWERILAIHADQLFTIGIVRGVPQPVVVSNRLHNVPMTAVYNWDPGAFFGVYHPDAFWFEPPPKPVVRDQPGADDSGALWLDVPPKE